MRIITAREQLAMLSPWRTAMNPMDEHIEAHPDYYYHGTSHWNAQDIQDEGHLHPHAPDYGTDQAAWPDNGTEDRSYWSHDPSIVRSFYPEEGHPTLLRAPRKVAPFKPERGTSDTYSSHPVPIEHLEAYSGGGNWTPLSEWSHTAAVSQEQRIQQTYDPAHLHFPPGIASHDMTHSERSDPTQKADIARNGIQRPVEDRHRRQKRLPGRGLSPRAGGSRTWSCRFRRTFTGSRHGRLGKPIEPHLQNWLANNPEGGFKMGVGLALPLCFGLASIPRRSPSGSRTTSTTGMSSSRSTKTPASTTTRSATGPRWRTS